MKNSKIIHVHQADVVIFADKPDWVAFNIRMFDLNADWAAFLHVFL